MSDQLMSLLQQGSGILVQLAVVAVLVLLRSFKNHLQSYYLSHTTTQQRQLLAQLGQEAFAFAETVYREMDGPAKLNEATKYLLDKSQSLGLGELPMNDVRAVIESAWLQNKSMLGATSTANASPTVGTTGDRS
ncbi:MAG: phage holin, LLH family [Tumebacillaceae bacterium]